MLKPFLLFVDVYKKQKGDKTPEAIAYLEECVGKKGEAVERLMREFEAKSENKKDIDRNAFMEVVLVSVMHI